MNAQTKVETSLIGALAKALPELEAAKKTKANPAFKSKYADLGAIIEALEPLAKHGIWFRQFSHERPEGACVETFYIHESGQEMSAGIVFMPATKKDAQGFGSAETYARRYGLQLAFGLATEDDDGNRAVQSQREAPPAVIDNAQWALLVQLIEASKADVQAFCTAYQIGSLKELPADAFPRAKAQLEKKLAALAKEDA